MIAMSLPLWQFLLILIFGYLILGIVAYMLSRVITLGVMKSLSLFAKKNTERNDDDETKVS